MSSAREGLMWRRELMIGVVYVNPAGMRGEETERIVCPISKDLDSLHGTNTDGTRIIELPRIIE